MCGRRHPGHTNAAVSSTRLVLLWVWTGPHVLLWTLCSFWVSLRRRQGLSAAGRLQPVGGRVKISLPVPVGGGSLCLSLVPAVLPSLQPFASRRPRPFHLSPAFLVVAHRSPRPFPSASPAPYKPRLLAFCFSASVSDCLSASPLLSV